MKTNTPGDLRVPEGSYTGNQQFAGTGLHRSCVKCNQHRPTLGGRTQRGTKLWTCAACLRSSADAERKTRMFSASSIFRQGGQP